MTKKILVADRMADEGIEVLRNAGYEVDVKLDMTPDELVATIPPYDALIVRSATPVTREAIEAAQNLKIIGRAGVTVDRIDVEAATEHDIIVCNAPTSNIVSAAEHTMALMLACAHNLAQANASMHAHKWEQTGFMGVELYGKTLAIYGLGRVGGLVAERAKAFGMKIVGHDPFCSRERAEALGVELRETVLEALADADFITVHVPRTRNTVGMFGPNEFAAMKDGVILLNAASGGIFDTESMADFIAAGKISAVGVDMHDQEPCFDSPLHEFPNAILTPRLASASIEAQRRAGTQIAEYVMAGLEGSLVVTAVNAAPLSAEVIGLVGPYVNACEMMGRIIAQIKGGIPRNIHVTTAGLISESDPTALVAGALNGILSYRRAGTVSVINAASVAQRHGIKVSTSTMVDAGEYASTVSISAAGVEAGTTLYGSSQAPRIVSLLGYKIDIIPGKNMLVFEYLDAPGRIGVIGTVLGEAGVNITTMQIGTKVDQDTALVVMNVEGDVPDEVLERLRAAIDDLKSLMHIKL
ncbi:phosphoglycerate dehydrogenase [Adlercreutzia sp. ZJ141]|uniref:phosphoglycerate dehydrogenase n=1 Tax=Adlercreutzia sp. ZJ141 TaxID=2709406 RepID=UPI0013EB2948|nr:phosphoglycerate dehydrogenase [Adlercreutzia sp. ZJ141]